MKKNPIRIRIPSPMDLHVHFRSPGQEYKEDFGSGSKAAIAGGITIVLDMPNNLTPIFSKKALSDKEKLVTGSYCDVGFFFGSDGLNLSEFPDASKRTAGLKLYLTETTGNYLVGKNRLEEIFRSWGKDKPVVIHNESESELDRLIGLSADTGVHIHVTHISSRAFLERIIEAKKEEIRITCDVTPHHLLLNTDYADGNPRLGLVKPPLQCQKDVDYLWEKIEFIDCICSDHAPHLKSEKEASDLYGFPGVQTLIPVVFTKAMELGIDCTSMVKMISNRPHEIFNIRKDVNSFCEVNTDTEYELKTESLYSKAGWSPYEGMTMNARVEKTVLRGETVFENGKIINGPKGRMVEYLQESRIK